MISKYRIDRVLVC